MACLGSARLSQVCTTPSVAASVPRHGSSSGGLAGQELKAASVPFPVRSSNGECSNGVFSAHKVVKGLRSGGVVRSEFLKGGDHVELLRRVVGEVQDVAAAKKTTNKKKKREAGAATVMAMAVSTTDEKKLLKGRCGAILEDVPHLTDWLPDLPTYANPLKHNPAYAAVRQYFVEDTDVVAKDVVVNINAAGDGVHFRRAGPRDKIYFQSEEVRAAIVTCGGLCPGINTVIREIVCCLWRQYNVREIVGIDGGYKGFYARNTIDLDPRVVGDIHKRGGTVLKSSRGGHDTAKIVDSIEDRGINQVYIIGGDGTQKGAEAIHEECVRRGLKVVVAGIPKTIDNDIDIIDKSFGFDTAVEEAQRAINAAHVEAESVNNGIGLVKLMGRYSGYIAMHATLASRDVDLCLIPEVPFYMHGRGGIIEYVQRRLKESGHMVIVVAEGAGQELIAESLESQNKLSDASGNKLLLDVGLWLCQNLKDHFLKEFKEPLNLKYIDPTYMIRAIPSNASDNVYCTLLAHSAIHGAMAGYCGFTVGPVNNRHCYIPIKRVVATSRSVNVEDRMWARLMSSTNQPSFSHYKEKIEEQRKLHAEQRETRSREKNGSSTATEGNGKLSSTDEAVKHGEILETGNGQAMPQNSKEASFLTTTVPGDPTANADHHAP